jgi:hypothetical protein
MFFLSNIPILKNLNSSIFHLGLKTRMVTVGPCIRLRGHVNSPMQMILIISLIVIHIHIQIYRLEFALEKNFKDLFFGNNSIFTLKKDYIKEIQEDPVRSKFCRVKILCRTLAENLVHLITITNPGTDEENSNKKGVVLTARVHPGETNSSWMMKGFLDFLMGNSPDAKVNHGQNIISSLILRNFI